MGGGTDGRRGFDAAVQALHAILPGHRERSPSRLTGNYLSRGGVGWNVMKTSTAPIVACPSCATRNRVPDDASGRPVCAKCTSDLPWLATATDQEYGPVVTSSPLPVLVDVWAPWCGPCRQVGPLVEALAAEYAGRLKVVKVNADDSPGVGAQLGVQGIPAMFFIRDGKVADQLVGARPMQDLRAAVERLLA
jgi:thioredoxin 2